MIVQHAQATDYSPPWSLKRSMSAAFPDRPTLRTCFLRLFDLQVIPRKSFFQVLASISTDPDEKEKLQEFASPEGLVRIPNTHSFISSVA